MKTKGGFKLFGKPSILRRLFITFTVFGLLVGALFPVLANMFVEWKPGMQTWFVVSCLAAGVIVGLFNIWVVNKLLLRKLNSISEIANSISNKDVSIHCEVESNDLIGNIVTSLNHMAENLRTTFSEVSDSSVQVADAAQRLSSISAETDSCLRDQQSQTEHVATAMRETTATVQEVANNAQQAAQAASDADQEAKNGALIATEAIGGLDALVSKVDEASSVLDGLREDSDNIGVVLDVIRGIAEQTNLLALNAAIEAARAGEQGRGFAVVADEVRTLASRTQQSTQEINDMIESLQTRSASAVQVMQEVRNKGEENSAQVEKAAESLAEIAGAVSIVDSMNTQIAAAADEQRTVAEEINQSVMQISEATEQTAAGTQQTSSASEQLTQLAGRLTTILDGYQYQQEQ